MSAWDEIERQLKAVAERGDAAWADLLIALTPELLKLARFQPIGRLKSDEDSPREIATGVMSRLRANEFRAIKKLFALDTPPKVRAWIRVLVRSAAIDFMRGQPEFARGNENREHGWVSLDTLVTRDGMVDAKSIEAKRRDVDRFIAKALAQVEAAVAEHDTEAAAVLAREWNVPVVHPRRLIKKAEDYTRVLALVFAGHSYPEVATKIGATRREVELTVGFAWPCCGPRRQGRQRSTSGSHQPRYCRPSQNDPLPRAHSRPGPYPSCSEAEHQPQGQRPQPIRYRLPRTDARRSFDQVYNTMAVCCRELVGLDAIASEGG